ncbi:MAG: alpha/beta hydrolase-fold protein [Bacteroidota bacterium]|nr:alpha/beta hydrolase-fold protein [Bacteroidota bacterium]MDP4216551.1 alpha/beta hydrolase-fold protein [Bacteroidota bacterium]MDP4245577.1 alpha/beta hydrolase-fold protein [Bacteroidota bacterium]MDP4257784.1 alpha/beta hydrolase-fold protein [Bacteroidota bacterium]
MLKQYFLLLFAASLCSADYGQTFRVSYPAAVLSAPFSGKVILYLNKENRNPKEAMADLDPFPCFSIDVRDIKPGTAVTFDDRAAAFPARLSDIERGEYYVQAVWDRNLGGRAIPESPGNLYSTPQKVKLTKEENAVFKLNCDRVVPQPKFTDSKWVKELKVASPLLSKSQGKEMTVDAAVLLPPEYYTQPQRQFPVLFVVSGYGGDYHRYSGDTSAFSRPFDSVSCITVYLDGNCAGGHSVYANSDNNGPWGDALTKEFIPQLEKTYRCNGARLLRGHSSGGWTVLWLQTHYPGVFAGCWSSSPDPVDFRNFQRVNLYEEDNIFYSRDGASHAVATIAGYFPVATMKQCYQQEFVLYRGEQMHSFNYVFSAKGPDGQPIPICDPLTGVIDKSCFEHWKSYDICAYLRNNWPALEKGLQSKIRVSVGNQDNFLLNYAVHMLEDEMKKLDTRFIFEYYPGDHFTLNTPEYQAAGARFLAERYAQWKGRH